MRKNPRCRIVPATILCSILLAIGASAIAAEPRPWLCRQIPVFSGGQPMAWRASKRGSGHWMITFMHYDPAGGHDGFTVVSAKELIGNTAGTLDSGQWYAVALHRSGERWICPRNASQSDRGEAGAISSLCYGADEDACDVRLVVRPASPRPSQ